MLAHGLSIEPLPGDRFDISKRLHLVTWRAHQLIGFAGLQRVRCRVLSDQVFCCSASSDAAPAALSFEQRVVLTLREIEPDHSDEPSAGEGSRVIEWMTKPTLWKASAPT
jgi:hypothetical protein